MGELRKITVNVPGELLDAAMAGTGKTLTETIREGLRIQANRNAWEKLASLRGSFTFEESWEELAGKNDEEKTW